MGKVILGITMSLDGFINDRNGSVERLYPDLAALAETELLQESIRETGAVVMGRNSYDMANGDLTGYEFQTPIFVLTHHPPDTAPKGQNDKLKVYFVTDGIESAVRQAKAAAGDQVVNIIGATNTAQQVLKAGLADELHIDIAPVLLGDGLRFVERAGIEPSELEIKRVVEDGGRIHLEYKL